MIEQTSQVGNSQPGHQLSYVVETKFQKPYRVSCSVCEHYIRLTLTGFYHHEGLRQTSRFFEAMAGECEGPK